MVYTVRHCPVRFGQTALIQTTRQEPTSLCSRQATCVRPFAVIQVVRLVTRQLQHVGSKGVCARTINFPAPSNLGLNITPSSGTSAVAVEL